MSCIRVVTAVVKVIVIMKIGVIIVAMAEIVSTYMS